MPAFGHGPTELPALDEIILPVTVVGGTGQATFQTANKSRAIIKAYATINLPGGETTQHGFDISDSDGYGCIGRAGLVGSTTIELDAACGSSNTLTVSSNVDGVFSVKLRVLLGHTGP